MDFAVTVANLPILYVLDGAPVDAIELPRMRNGWRDKTDTKLSIADDLKHLGPQVLHLL
jgi:hypothetical protein